MRDGFRGYGKWKLMSQEDVDAMAEQKRLRDEAKEDRADYEHDRRKDEAAERRRKPK